MFADTSAALLQSQDKENVPANIDFAFGNLSTPMQLTCSELHRAQPPIDLITSSTPSRLSTMHNGISPFPLPLFTPSPVAAQRKAHMLSAAPNTKDLEAFDFMLQTSAKKRQHAFASPLLVGNSGQSIFEWNVCPPNLDSGDDVVPLSPQWGNLFTPGTRRDLFGATPTKRE
jgi:hypothetical protein